MLRNKKKIVYIVLVIFLLIIISVGYAVLNSTLIINGKSNISKNIWSVHFENIKIKDGSVTASVEPTITNNTTIANFELTLDKPGDFYEFIVDVKNSGTIDAMIDSIIKEPELTDSQTKYLNYIIEYENGEKIKTKQLVNKGTFVRLKVRVEFKNDITNYDLPLVDEKLNLGFTINYVQADETGLSVFDNGALLIKANGDINEIGTIVSIGTENFYTIGTEGDDVKLLSMYNLYVGNEVLGYNEETGELNTNFLSETGIQSPLAQGAKLNIDFSLSLPWLGTIEYSNNQHSNYNGSVIEKYVNQYKNILESKYSAKIKEARLITKEELIDPTTFNCDEENHSCFGSPHFWINSTSYWTMTPLDGNDGYVWFVADGLFEIDYVEEKYIAGVRPVIVIPKSEIIQNPKQTVAYGDINNMATIVQIGSEKFYTIGTEGDNVKLLSMYNLEVGKMVIDVNNILPIKNPSGMQNKNAKGISINQFNGETNFPIIGTTIYSNEEQHREKPTDYSGSVIEEYVNNYKNKLEELFKVDIKEARLFSSKELDNIELKKCATDEDLYCFNPFQKWIYLTSYWTDIPYEEEMVNCIISMGGILTLEYNYESFCGVRPIIVVSKTLF